MAETKQDIKPTQEETTEHRISPKVAVIVINWNGWRDSVECLESLQCLTYPNYQVIVVDNGSTDGSVERIKAWARGEIPVESKSFDYDSTSKPVQWIEYDRAMAKAGRIVEKVAQSVKLPFSCKLVLIQAGENLGFAGGSNIGIEYALTHNFDYVFLLNNDAIVATDTLHELVLGMENSPHLAAATAKIYYYDEPERIANAGGRLTITGSRKYYEMNRIEESRINKKCVTPVTYATGCALLIRASVLKEFGPLSTDFFHGEEDIEFSLRMKRLGLKMACVHSAHVYHKIGRSINKLLEGRLDAIFLHYLNRFVHMKRHYRRFYWRLWRYGALAYILPMLYRRYKVDHGSLLKLARNLLAASEKYDRVTKDVVLNIQRDGLL